MAYTAQTLTPDIGTDGRVRNFTTQKIISGISKWSLNQTAAVVPYPHFESSTQANGTVVPNKLRGLGDYKVNIEGWFNINVTDGTPVTSSTNFVNGAYVVVDLLNNKTSSLGYGSVPGWVSNLVLDVDVNNQVQKFTMTLEVDGPLPVWGVVS